MEMCTSHINLAFPPLGSCIPLSIFVALHIFISFSQTLQIAQVFKLKVSSGNWKVFILAGHEFSTDVKETEFLGCLGSSVG